MSNEPDIFRHRILILRAIGCWPLIRTRRTRSEIAYTVAACLSLVNSFVGSLLSFCTLVGYVYARADMEQICNQTLAFIIAFQVLSKSGLTFVNSHRLQRLIDNLNEGLGGRFAVAPRHRRVLRSCYAYDVKLSIFFALFSMLVTIANILKPLIVTLSHRGNQTNPFIGEFPSKYPFEYPYNSVWYVIWFVQQVTVVLPGGFASWISDSMLCSFLYYTCGHFDILMDVIRERGSEVRAREIVQHHRQIIRFANDTIRLFGPLMVIQLLLAAITICCLLFQFVSITGEPVQYARPLAYLTLKFIQIYIMCWHGQLLLDKTAELGECLYFTPWYGESRIDRMDLRILMVRMRAPIRVSYFAIFKLSAGTFAQILNAAYGYFAMMSKMTKA